jgi:hypothetical protein
MGNGESEPFVVTTVVGAFHDLRFEYSEVRASLVTFPASAGFSGNGHL